MTRKVLTPAAAMEIKRLYALEDEKGNKLHSQSSIAADLGVSETTVFRTIHKRGAYMALPELKTDEEAAASLERLQRLVAAEKAKPAAVNAMLEEATAGDAFVNRDLAKEKGYIE